MTKRTRQEYIDILRSHADVLKTNYGISYMRLFGSVAKDITMYFNVNPKAFEVLVFKGSKSLIVKRKATTAKDFVKKFMFSYYK